MIDDPRHRLDVPENDVDEPASDADDELVAEERDEAEG
jgi:hypothetical protein